MDGLTGVIQVIPVNRPTFVVYMFDEEDGTMHPKPYGEPVVFFVLTTDQEILPVVREWHNNPHGTFELMIENGSTQNYVGLWQPPYDCGDCEPLEKLRNRDWV